jgi:hypothetical protein
LTFYFNYFFIQFLGLNSFHCSFFCLFLFILGVIPSITLVKLTQVVLYFFSISFFDIKLLSLELSYFYIFLFYKVLSSRRLVKLTHDDSCLFFNVFFFKKIDVFSILAFEIRLSSLEFYDFFHFLFYGVS